MTLSLSASISRTSVERIETKRPLLSRSVVSTKRHLHRPTTRTTVFNGETPPCAFCVYSHCNTQYPCSLFLLADSALDAAGRAKKGKTNEATDAFQVVQEEIEQVIKRSGFLASPRKVVPGDHRKKLSDPSTALESAFKRDEESRDFLEKVRSTFKAPVSRLPWYDYPFVHDAALESQWFH